MRAPRQQLEQIAETYEGGGCAQTARLLRRLVAECATAGDLAMKHLYTRLLDDLETEGAIFSEVLKTVVAASEPTPRATRPERVAPRRRPRKPKPTQEVRYEVLVVDPGREPIRLVREIRSATGLKLQQVKDLVEGKRGLPNLSQKDVNALVAQIEGAGARAEVKREGKLK